MFNQKNKSKRETVTQREQTKGYEDKVKEQRRRKEKQEDEKSKKMMFKQKKEKL